MPDQPSASQPRPPLTTTIDVNDFQSFYWLKKELIAFCREHGISTVGSKTELAARIAKFLRSGEVDKPSRSTSPHPTAPRRRRSNLPTEPLSVQTVITENYSNSQANRKFFKSVLGPGFHFDVHFMDFMKQNVGKTYQDAIDEWHKQEARKKEPAYQTEIAPQFEYNQHMREFFASNLGKTRQDAIAVWNEKKSRRKSKK